MTLTGAGTVHEAIVLARDTLIRVPPDATGRTEIVPALRKYVEQCSGLTISLQKRNLNQAHTRGLILRYTDRATIVVGHELNHCWRRFVICKELMHLLVDVKPECFTTDPVAQLAKILMGDGVHGAHIESEAYAIVAALEFMLPKGHRPANCKDATEALSIAERFKLPRMWVDFFYGTAYRLISSGVA